jgi:catechol 2,3-dioxygenase-like lactoylglutathione lyase family enzyme
MSPVQFNHTIMPASDKLAAARWFAELFGVGEPVEGSVFAAVELDGGVVMLFAENGSVTQHYAFLVGEDEFDAILARIEERGLAHWADPGRSRPGINTLHGGRGVYFEDPYGNLLEAITRPYSGIP